MISLALYLFLFLLAKPTQASEILFRDDFSKNSLNEWAVVRNSQHHHPEKTCFNNGFPAQWEIVDEKLGIDINGIACITEIIPQNLDLSKINNYEFEFEWYFPISTHMDRNILIKWHDKNNWYGLHVLDNKILVQKVIDGQVESLYNNWGYYSFEADQSYDFKISVINDLITVLINDQLILETLDRPPFLTGSMTPGFQASSGNIFHSSSFFDNLIVKSLDKIGEKKLSVPLYKQSDPKWKNHEYDQANKWSSYPTIGRWGCALTSITMILDYYDIDLLPADKKLNPASLNAWLKKQPDGFIGEGLINWLAVTRLTRIMGDILDTPILEYGWLDGDVKNAIDEISLDQPVVLQLPGHFLVASGYDVSQTDLFIKDPAYNRNLLSQHPTELMSVRSFKPSQTDLSYLLIVHDPETKVDLIDESDQLPAELKIYSEYIQSSADDEQTKIKIIQSLAKPANGKYLLKTNNEENGKIEIYTYDVDGEVTTLSQETMGTKLFKLNYDAQDKSELTEITNKFTLLRELLRTLYESQEITTKYAYLKLDQLAVYAEKDEMNQDRYQKLIIKTAQELEEFIPYSTVSLSLAPSS
jgi:hypothetical protein